MKTMNNSWFRRVEQELVLLNPSRPPIETALTIVQDLKQEIEQTSKEVARLRRAGEHVVAWDVEKDGRTAHRRLAELTEWVQCVEKLR